MSRPGSATAELTRRVTRRWGGKSRWRCVYCGRQPANQIDHFQPEHGGGGSEPENLMPACADCNVHKADHDPIKWMKAVGVPFERASVLWGVRHGERPPAMETFTEISLNYSATPPKVAPVAVAPCGTDSAYRRHRRRHEDCRVCREAHTAAAREWRKRRVG